MAKAYLLHLFVAFLGTNQFRWVGLRVVCWFNYENTQRVTESGFKEKPGIEGGDPWFTRQKSSSPGYKPVLPGWFKICVRVL